MLKILSNPILRKVTASILTVLIGFFLGYSFKEDQLKKAEKNKHFAQAKHIQLKEHFNILKVEKDTLINVLIKLAGTEKIKIENHISDTKVKKGAELNFTPKTEALIRTLTTRKIQEIAMPEINSIPEKNTPYPIEKKENMNFLQRIFRRRKQ